MTCFPKHSLLTHFVNGIIHLASLDLSIIILKGYQDENLKLVSQQYKVLLDCANVQAGLALYAGGKH